MKENRKLLREVLNDIRHDMTDEEVLNLLADSKISVRTDLMILQVPNQIALSRRQESSDDSPVCFWLLEQNRHRNKFLQTASLDFPESLFQSKISVFQDFPTVRDDSC